MTPTCNTCKHLTPRERVRGQRAAYHCPMPQGGAVGPTTLACGDHAEREDGEELPTVPSKGGRTRASKALAEEWSEQARRHNAGIRHTAPDIKAQLKVAKMQREGLLRGDRG